MKTPSLTVQHWAGEANAIASSIATTLSSWLSPVPEAVMTARAIGEIFELPMVWAGMVAASIELVGVSVNAHYLEAVDFNEEQERIKEQYGRKTYRHALEDAGSAKGFVVTFYVVTGLIVAGAAVNEAIIERNPLNLLAILFPVASAIGTITMNRRAALHRKLALIEQESSARSKASDARSDDERSAEAEPSKPGDAKAARSDAKSNGKRLACPYCGADSNARGEPFKTKQAVSAHLAYCEHYQRAKERERAKATAS
jgi:hypothetical protein